MASDTSKPALAEEIRRAALIRVYAPGEMIFGPMRQPENVWLVEHGLVRMHRHASDGRQMTIALLRPGHVFGEVPVLSDSPRVSFAEAMRRSTLLADFARNLPARGALGSPKRASRSARRSPDAWLRIESRLEDLAFRSVDVRVIRTLLRLAEDFGQLAGEWIQLELSLTQSELATLVGTTRQSVNESLRSLVERGVVARDRGRLALKSSALKEDRRRAYGLSRRARTRCCFARRRCFSSFSRTSSSARLARSARACAR